MAATAPPSTTFLRRFSGNTTGLERITDPNNPL
ncbi:hypothetical protein TorRG33x02_357090 [Trema orientale]|uniref:Uncharacterized protein n=1 Tax=Trema orientale TaxID=63057 RepID=A0A2P5A5W8_TREOI|nr:hypothetical protein TorRG33x02_357090 [Trema orientale]